MQQGYLEILKYRLRDLQFSADLIIFTEEILKVAPTDMRYFARSKLSRNLVHKKNFSLICFSRKILLDRRYDESLSIYLRIVGMTIL